MSDAFSRTPPVASRHPRSSECYLCSRPDRGPSRPSDIRRCTGGPSRRASPTARRSTLQRGPPTVPGDQGRTARGRGGSPPAPPGTRTSQSRRAPPTRSGATGHEVVRSSDRWTPRRRERGRVPSRVIPPIASGLNDWSSPWPPLASSVPTHRGLSPLFNPDGDQSIRCGKRRRPIAHACGAMLRPRSRMHDVHRRCQAWLFAVNIRADSADGRETRERSLDVDAR